MAKILKKDKLEFKRALKSFKDEADIENAYRTIFRKKFVENIQGAIFNRPFNTDGYLQSGELVLVLRLLMEIKQGYNLMESMDRTKIIVQVIYYLKAFEKAGQELPNVIFGGDEDQMFVVYAPVLFEYLKNDEFDWNIAPSSAWKENINLVRMLNDDANLSSFVFDIHSKNFDINDVFDAIESLALNDGNIFKIKVTEANIRVVFDEFVRMIFSDERKVKPKISDPKQIVSIFIMSILGSKDVYPVPTKRNVLHLLNGDETTIDTSAYNAFFSRYDRKYTMQEQDRIIEIADQLIEEANRRFSGDFWTPTVWANRAIEMIDSQLGTEWKDNYVVWDAAAGTKNLTRDYQFKKLFSSTLFQEELDISNQYNPDSIIFQYDFLNDDIDVTPNSNPLDLKMPLQLFESLKNNEPIIFYMNPPYATATNAGANGTSKSNVAKTKVNTVMKLNKMGASSQQLYAQFIYRVIKLKNDFKLTNVVMAFFTKSQFMTGGTYWQKLIDEIMFNFSFKCGNLFNASEFSDVSDQWPITFSIFQSKEINDIQNNGEYKFKLSVEELNENGIHKVTSKLIESVNQTNFISTWVKEPIKNKPKQNGIYPQLSSAFNVNESNSYRGSLIEDSLGYMVNLSNNVFQSQRDVFILNGSAYKANGFNITADNFDRAVVNFAVRKSIKHTWINDMDNFRKPTKEILNNPDWNTFVNDCLIYSLFNILASYQVSYRNLNYKSNLYNRKNEWFFMSIDEIKKLAQKNYFIEIEQDLKFEKDERFVYKEIEKRTFSKEAQLTLDKAVSLVVNTFKYRDLMHLEHPEYHLMAWDAGFYQIFKIANVYCKDEFESFRECFNTLENKIEISVYKNKFLTK